MFTLLRRALRTASREDLEQVVLHCVAFTDGLRAQGFITEELAREAASYLNPGAIHDAIATDGPADGSATDRTALPGQGAPHWADEEWQEHLGQETDLGLSDGHESGDAQGVASSTSSDLGHQAEMEGDDDSLREVGTEVVPEDGPR